MFRQKVLNGIPPIAQKHAGVKIRSGMFSFCLRKMAPKCCPALCARSTRPKEKALAPCERKRLNIGRSERI